LKGKASVFLRLTKKDTLIAGKIISNVLGKKVGCIVFLFRAMKPDVLIETGIAHGKFFWVIF